MTLRTQVLTGGAIAPLLPELARLRIEVFRDWPYIYDGSYDYERRYLADLAAEKDAVVVAAIDGGRMVGAATASPLGVHAGELIKPFVEKGVESSDIFYFGESVLLRAYRGRGIGHAFFDGREAAARERGFKRATFCAVVRPDDHPLRPADYRPLDAFWAKRGYARVPGLIGSFAWQDIGADAETRKPMQFWMRDL